MSLRYVIENAYGFELLQLCGEEEFVVYRMPEFRSGFSVEDQFSGNLFWPATVAR
jgi:hypothetical protein